EAVIGKTRLQPPAMLSKITPRTPDELGINRNASPAIAVDKPKGTAIATCALAPRLIQRCPRAPIIKSTSAPKAHGSVVYTPTAASEKPKTVPRYGGDHVVRKPCTQKFESAPNNAAKNATLNSARQILTGFWSSTLSVSVSSSAAASSTTAEP